MNCFEFQKVLPFIIESRRSLDEHEHLERCAICSGLVRDLQYIADQAKMLLPMTDPSPKVWENIYHSLQSCREDGMFNRR